MLVLGSVHPRKGIISTGNRSVWETLISDRRNPFIVTFIYTRCWQLKYFFGIFTLNLGEMIQFDEHIFFKWVVQAPTRFDICILQIQELNEWWFFLDANQKIVQVPYVWVFWHVFLNKFETSLGGTGHGNVYSGMSGPEPGKSGVLGGWAPRTEVSGFTSPWLVFIP